MKSYYTKKEMRKIITDEVVKIINNNPEALLTNSSFGVGLNLVIGIDTYDQLTRWFVGLERAGDWRSDKYTLVVIKEYKNKIVERTELMTVFEMYARKGYMYFTSEEPIKKHYERYSMPSKKKTMFVDKKSDLAKKLIAKLELKTNRKIKNQDLIVSKNKRGYTIKYIYRKQEHAFSLNFK